MKLKFVLVVAIAAVMFSCKKDTEVVVPTSTARIAGTPTNGSPFDLWGDQVYLEKDYTKDSIPKPIYKMSVFPSTNPLQVFSIILTGRLKADLYGMGSKEAQARFSLGSLPDELYKTTNDSSAITGYVNLTKVVSDSLGLYPENLVGTFSVTMVNSKGNKISVNAGSFNCTYLR